MRPEAKANINLDALRHNLSRVKELAPGRRVVSVIKANAYGHGVIPVAKALGESDNFAVARLDEALYLYDSLQPKNIIILEGVYSEEDYLKCIELNLIPVIHCLEQFQWLQECLEYNSLGWHQIEYWLKIDTGMHRLGLSEDELEQIILSYQHLESEKISSYLPAVFISHFSCADEKVKTKDQKQIELFKHQIHRLSNLLDPSAVPKSMANSAAILSIPEAHYDWVRPGIMLYGVSPFETAVPSRNGLDEQLQPVMTLSSELIAIKKLKKGDCIGYGATWCCPEDMSIGVIAIGYGDGYPRHAEPGTPVLVSDKEVPLIGRVSMDMITVDLRTLEKNSVAFKIGDRVILWGDGLPIERVSQKSGTIAYELLCQITQRVRFEYE